VGGPHDLEEFRLLSHAIVRVRLNSQFTDAVPFDGEIEVWAFRDATVLEVLKGVRKDLRVGQSITITEWRGRDAPRPGVLQRLLPYFNVVVPRSEWILFLQWERGFPAPVVMELGAGAFQIVDGVIKTRSHYSWMNAWPGRTDPTE
jgi:hypothetical protein